jgi:MFS family permease
LARTDGRGAGFVAVARVPEFRALWLAELLSVLGDQLARVALAVLVYGRTSSAMLAALTYALTFAPAVLGGAFLSGLADRFPRRTVLVVTDVVRAVLAAAMAVPGIPLGVLWTFVALLSMASGPFKAAQLAVLPTVVTGDHYVSAMSLRLMSTQIAQLAGFACGGLLLAVVPAPAVLAINASTFAISAVLVLTGVRKRPAASAEPVDTAQEPTERGAVAGVVPIFAMVMLIGLFVVPEGIAAPYGDALGTGPTGVGLLMMADPLGSAVGAWLLARSGLVASWRSMVLLAALAGVPLIACAVGPMLALSMLLWAATGALSTAYLIQAQALLVELVPDRRRGRVMGRLATGLYTSQGLAVVLGGGLSELTGPFRAVGAAGLLGVVLSCGVGLWWWRGRSRGESDRGDSPGLTDDDQMSLLHISGTSSRGDTGADGDTQPASQPIGRQGRPLSTSSDGD